MAAQIAFAIEFSDAITPTFMLAADSRRWCSDPGIQFDRLGDVLHD
jgi:hypothetical protein